MRRRRKRQAAPVQRNNRGEMQIWATAEHLAELGRVATRPTTVAGPIRPMRPGHDRSPRSWPRRGSAPARAEGELTARAEATELCARAERAEARADRLEAEHRATVAELRAELAEARRPWLAKVLEGLRRKGAEAAGRRWR